jgi:hypothetical protein
MPRSLKTLERMEKLGFELLGSSFKDTLAYVQIQREKKELQNSPVN